MFIELSYQEQPVMRKEKGMEEGKQVGKGHVDEISGAPFTFSLPSPQVFLSLEMVGIARGLGGLEKLVCVQGAHGQRVAELCLSLLWKFITGR